MYHSYGCATFYIYLWLVGIWVASVFGYCEPCCCRPLLASFRVACAVISLRRICRSGIAGSDVTLFNFGGTAGLFSKLAAHFTLLPAILEGSSACYLLSVFVMEQV